MPHRLSELDTWMTPSEGVESIEINSMMSLLNHFCESFIPIEFEPINDISDAFGVELFWNNTKIAEIYVAEDRNGIISNQFTTHCLLNWDKPVFGDISQTRSLIMQCVSLSM